MKVEVAVSNRMFVQTVDCIAETDWKFILLHGWMKRMSSACDVCDLVRVINTKT